MRLRGIVLTMALALLLADGASGQSFATWIQSPVTQRWYSVVPSTAWYIQSAYAAWIGGSLAVIDDQTEQDWLISQPLVNAHPLLFLGPNGAAGTGDWQTPSTIWDQATGGYVVTSGESVAYFDWCGPPPPPSSSEDVAVLSTASNCWHVENGWNTAGHPALVQLNSMDVDANGKPDNFELVVGQGDVDQNGLLDVDEISVNPSLDCNLNGVLDVVDVTNFSFAQNFDEPGVGAPFATDGAGVIDSALELTVGAVSHGGMRFPGSVIQLSGEGVMIEFQFRLSSGPDGFSFRLIPFSLATSTDLCTVFHMFFDTFKNPWDPDDNHIDVQAGGPTLQIPAIFDLNDNSTYSVALRLGGGTATLDVTSSTGQTQRFINDHPSPDATGGPVFLELVGFSQQDQRIDNIVVTALGVAADCDSNAVPDTCQLAANPNLDCNANEVLDSCDILAGTSADLDASLTPDECDVHFRRGECNDIGAIDLADAIYLLNYIFTGAAAPHCLDACDMNDDGHVNLADSVFILVALYEGGAPPAAPYLVCGVDVGADAVGCEVYAGCP